jgi:hypothetical protein
MRETNILNISKIKCYWLVKSRKYIIRKADGKAAPAIFLITIICGGVSITTK